ncbi:MAG: hypothetical protein R3346_02825 [Candidatus Spechtbacterales bacterium]|nr:hypothetical protein [Candidatus Spechtbacterales bacterium]
MAGNTVTGEQRDEIQKLFWEIERQLRQRSGYPYNIKELRDHLVMAIEGEFSKFRFERDMAKECGWALFFDTGFSPHISSVRDFDVVEFLYRDEQYIKWPEFQERAFTLNANLGQEVAEYLLKHQEEIPADWRQKMYLLFPGTIWKKESTFFIPALSFNLNNEWGMQFLRHDSNFHGQLLTAHPHCP